jgi:cardiolipin synthase
MWTALRNLDAELQTKVEEARGSSLMGVVVPIDDEPDPRTRGELRAFQVLATAPMTNGNSARLLVNGEATFNAIFAAIDAAQQYVLAQFYIIHDDKVGRRFKDCLIAAARRGVAVHLLYDDVGSSSLPSRYVRELGAAGVEVSRFRGSRAGWGGFASTSGTTGKSWWSMGKTGLPADSMWETSTSASIHASAVGRDTHLALTGPAVLGLQYSFIRDWYYSRKEVPPRLRWAPEQAAANQRALVLASGPEDNLERCGLPVHAHHRECRVAPVDCDTVFRAGWARASVRCNCGISWSRCPGPDASKSDNFSSR